MVVGKRRAYRFVDFEPPAGSEEKELGRGEGVLFAELQQPVVESAAVGAIEAVDAEVEV